VEVPPLGYLFGEELATAIEARVGEVATPVPLGASSSVAWAESGAMALTGRFNGRPLEPAGAVATMAQVVATLIARISRAIGREAVVDGPVLLGERAALAGLWRAGDISCGGAARLIRGADGWTAVSLPRESDFASVEAWLEAGPPGRDPWLLVARELARRPVDAVVERGRLLGLPVARVGEHGWRPPAILTESLGPARQPSRLEGVVVVDLSSLWAGPLCAQLLHQAGAEVIKVEAVNRPDGARRGPRRFYDLLHAGHRSVALDFTSREGRAQLATLVARADVVIEASRPRALRQLGIEAGPVGARGCPAVWVSITGYGRAADVEDRVAFGDDAAAAGGLVAWDPDGACFVADAVADPLTGLLAAAGALGALAAGGTWLLDVSLARSAALAAVWPRSVPISEDGRDGSDLAAALPRARVPKGPAAALGADTSDVLRWLRLIDPRRPGCATLG
jgi:CoA-transferase family III